MARNSLNTYLVVIRSHRHFELEAREAVCYCRQGYRGLLVTDNVPKAKHLTIVKRLSGNKSKDPEALAWVSSNLLKIARANQPACQEDCDRSIAVWQRAKKLIVDAYEAEAEARLAVAMTHAGLPVVVDGKTLHPTSTVTKDGLETILFFENTGYATLDTV